VRQVTDNKDSLVNVYAGYLLDEQKSLSRPSAERDEVVRICCVSKPTARCESIFFSYATYPPLRLVERSGHVIERIP